ncbi:helix-turn-helix transcriptional regulator [Actinoallomurus sp. CA-142502]|uniref:helix-turn-helix transcriptional regulator n=1 Tax=Actinoallomurus sp. CA-142502 TaxID=3239885 RepID=UPI003D8DB68E
MTHRTLELLAHLQTGRRFSGEELAARLDVSPRTLRRDVERLREYGYPVTTRPGPSGFYQLSAGRTLPPLILDDDEVVATLAGLALLGSTTAPDSAADSRGGIGPAADRAYGKIDQFLPKRLRPRVTAFRATVEAAPQFAPNVDADVLAILGSASARHERVTFTYTSRTGGTTARRVEPYRQVHFRLRWYLLAWDLDRADWRTFRLDRVSAISATGTPFTPRPLPARSAAAYLREEVSAGRHQAVVVVDAPPAMVGDALRFQDFDLVPLPGGRSRVTAWVDSFEWLTLNLVPIGADFLIEEPAEFRDRCRELASRLKRAAR